MLCPELSSPVSILKILDLLRTRTLHSVMHSHLSVNCINVFVTCRSAVRSVLKSSVSAVRKLTFSHSANPDIELQIGLQHPIWGRVCAPVNKHQVILIAGEAGLRIDYAGFAYIYILRLLMYTVSTYSSVLFICQSAVYHKFVS